jgi:glucosamine-6-phosphate deaminase
MITIKVFENYDELSAQAAEMFKEVLNTTENPVLGLATGSSPEGLYKALVEMHKNKELDFSNVSTVNLDEYVGLSGDHDQSYRYFMNTHLFDHVNIDKAKTFVPNGLAQDLEQEGKDYDQRIKDLGGVDLQVLGIGSNGHIGFNEPAEKLVLGTHVEDLTESTIEANSRFFETRDDVPKRAISMGLGTILDAKKIILVASGKSKAEAIASLVDEYITTQVPATLLKLHPDVTVLVDKEAASLL